jgi:hypothetical protein
MQTGCEAMMKRAGHGARRVVGALLLVMLCVVSTACGDSLAYTAYNDEADRPQPSVGPQDMVPGTDQMEPIDEFDDPPFDAPAGDNNSNAPLNNTTPTESDTPIDGGGFPHSNKTYPLNEEDSLFLDEAGISMGIATGAITIQASSPLDSAMIQLEGQPVPENVFYRAHFDDGTKGMWEPIIIEVNDPGNVRARAEFDQAIMAFDVYVQDPQGLTAILVMSYGTGTPQG